VKLLRGDGPLLRIGHRGAAALAPANTIQAVEAALAHGVNLVELDVFGRPDRTLLLAHSRKELGDEPVILEDVFEFLAETAPEVGLLADLKGAGWEQELVRALRRHDLVERTVASTSDVRSLRVLRRIEPRLGRSRTYPRGRLFPGSRRASIPVRGPVLTALRHLLPFRIARLIEEVGASAMTLKHDVVSRRVVERCHELGVAVLVWTVNDEARLRRLDALGVDGVISDDPRIFCLPQHAEKRAPPERPRADGTKT
jgi:glycerophosphoryl diester phosphodiesterase